MFFLYLSSLVFFGETGLVFSLCLLGGVGEDVVWLLDRVVVKVLFVGTVKLVTFNFGPFLSAERKKHLKECIRFYLLTKRRHMCKVLFSCNIKREKTNSKYTIKILFHEGRNCRKIDQ